MLKYEFEREVTQGQLLSVKTYKIINDWYMSTDEKQLDFIHRVFPVTPLLPHEVDERVETVQREAARETRLLRYAKRGILPLLSYNDDITDSDYIGIVSRLKVLSVYLDADFEIPF